MARTGRANSRRSAPSTSRRFHDEPDLVVMTLLAGIGVTLVREPRRRCNIDLALRLWCDASYATYLQAMPATLARPAHLPGEQR